MHVSRNSTYVLLLQRCCPDALFIERASSLALADQCAVIGRRNLGMDRATQEFAQRPRTDRFIDAVGHLIICVRENETVPSARAEHTLAQSRDHRLGIPFWEGEGPGDLLAGGPKPLRRAAGWESIFFSSFPQGPSAAAQGGARNGTSVPRIESRWAGGLATNWLSARAVSRGRTPSKPGTRAGRENR